MNLKDCLIKKHLMIAQIITFIVITLLTTCTNISNYYAAHYMKFALAFGAIATTIHIIVLTIRHWLLQKDTV